MHSNHTSDADASLANLCGGAQVFVFMAMLETILRSKPDIAGTARQPQVEW